MLLNDLMSEQSVLASLKAANKKQVLQQVSEVAAAQVDLPEREIFEALLQRERLGSTGVGNGIAIPHGKLQRCPRLICVFARLERPVDFDALDGGPVDLVFALLAPEAAGADHLKALSRIARAVRDPAVAAKLRATRDRAALFSVLSQDSTSHAA